MKREWAQCNSDRAVILAEYRPGCFRDLVEGISSATRCVLQVSLTSRIRKSTANLLQQFTRSPIAAGGGVTVGKIS